ncbi:MAG: phosphate acyltransferase, partial [Janthinobacterium lividum]
AANAVRAFGIVPKAALMSHSSFGSSNSDSARRMRKALALVRVARPELEVDGEMHPDAALVEVLRDRAVPDSRLSGTANLLVMPGLDAANIAFNLLKAGADGLQIGPLLLGMSKPIHVLIPSVTARGIVNISAVAAMEGALGVDPAVAFPPETPAA